MLSKVDQDQHISAIPHLDRDDPMYHWIFRNADFRQWSSAKCPQVLCLYGPPERKIYQVSSHIVGEEKKTDHLVLYFFCSAAIKSKLIISSFVHTLLEQIVRSSPTNKKILIIQSFLHILLQEAFRKESVPSWKERGFDVECLPKGIEKILHVATADELLTALKMALDGEGHQRLLIVVDGLDKVKRQRAEFISCIRALVEHLQYQSSNARILLTGRPLDEIKDLFGEFLCIEHDKERRGLSSFIRCPDPNIHEY